MADKKYNMLRLRDFDGLSDKFEVIDKGSYGFKVIDEQGNELEDITGNCDYVFRTDDKEIEIGDDLYRILDMMLAAEATIGCLIEKGEWYEAKERKK